MIAVSNSTPLIALSKIGRLDQLRDYFDEVLIPEEVYDEVVRRGGNLAGAVGILLLASQDGKLDLKRTMDDLKVVGFRLSNKEYERILLLNDKHNN